MKRGTIIGLLLLLLGGAVTGIWMWRKWTPISQAGYQPATLTAGEKGFIQSGYHFLDSQLLADEEAAKDGHFSSVRDFARRAAEDHRNQASHLKQLALNIEPNLSLETGKVDDALKELRGAAFDRQYLDSFIRQHGERLDALEHFSAIEGNSELAQFVSLWQAMLNRHFTEARGLRGGLPDTASNLPSCC